MCDERLSMYSRSHLLVGLPLQGLLTSIFFRHRQNTDSNFQCIPYRNLDMAGSISMSRFS